MMPRALLTLTLIALAAPLRAAETCDAVKRVDGPPVYVIMYGYPDSPDPEVESLTMVDRDLVNMARLFHSLGPRRAFVHGAESKRMQAHFGEARRPASWRALMTSVDEAIADLDELPMPSPDGIRPQVYLYFVGHGDLDSRDRLRMFTAAEVDADGPGYDGKMDSRLIADHIVKPLSERADVHLIVDTCHGYHMVQTRGPYTREKLEPRAPLSMAYTLDFAEQFPGAGAVLAGRALTPEVAPYGGVFSHLVRSLAIGPADLDRDGIITYGEMADALPQVVPDMEHAPDPEVIAPGGDRDRPFVDWRGSPAARVCFASEGEGKFIVYDKPELYATVRLTATPIALWLPLGRTLGLEIWGGAGRYFVAQSGPVTFLERSPFDLAPRPDDAGAEPTPDAATLGAWEPLPSMLANAPTLSARIDAPPERSLPLSAGFAVLGGVTLLDIDEQADVQRWLHADLTGRIGHGRHRLLGEVSYARASAHASRADPSRGPAPVEGHRVGGRIGYGRLITEGAVDVSGGLLVGLHQMWGESGPPRARRMLIQEYALRGSLIWPFDSHGRWGMRVDAELGLAFAGRPIGPTLKLALGMDFEAILYP